jgi:hypothetical protein
MVPQNGGRYRQVVVIGEVVVNSGLTAILIFYLASTKSDLNDELESKRKTSSKISFLYFFCPKCFSAFFIQTNIPISFIPKKKRFSITLYGTNESGLCIFTATESSKHSALAKVFTYKLILVSINC